MSADSTHQQHAAQPDSENEHSERDGEQKTPSREEEMRGAQPPNDDPSGSAVREREARPTGNTADVVDLDDVDETGSLRSAHDA